MMKKFFFACFGFFCVSLFLFLAPAGAQTAFQKTSASPQIKFQETIGGGTAGFLHNEVGYAIQQTADGGYIVVGSTQSFSLGDKDVYLTKISANGTLEWTKTFGGQGTDIGYFVKQTADGGYIITGETNSFFGPGFGATEVYLIKTDGSGNELWSKTFGGTDYDHGYNVQEISGGGYIIVGSTENLGPSSFDVYLIRTDANGDLLWTKTYGPDVVGDAIQQTTDGGFIIGGTTDLGGGHIVIILIKTDANGNVLWTKTYGGISFNYGNFVQQTSDGGYIITGYTISFGAGNADVYLIKTDGNGNVTWAKTYGGIEDDMAFRVRQTSDAFGNPTGYIITGHTWSFGAGNYDVYLIKTDDSGNLLWSKTFGGPDYDYSYFVQQTTDGGYVVVGKTRILSALNDDDIYLIKTDDNGNGGGCYEAPAATNELLVTAATQITTPTLQINSFGISASVATISGTGGFVTPLCTTVDIHEITTNDAFSIFPNPCSGDFVVTLKNPIDRGTVEVFGSRGEKVFGREIRNASKVEVKLENISEGMYVVNVFDGKNHYTKKIVIQ